MYLHEHSNYSRETKCQNVLSETHLLFYMNLASVLLKSYSKSHWQWIQLNCKKLNKYPWTPPPPQDSMDPGFVKSRNRRNYRDSKA